MDLMKDRDFADAYVKHLRTINVTRIQLGCFLGIILVPLFGVLDFFIFGAQFRVFLSYRVACSIATGLLYLLTLTQRGKNYINVIGVCVPLLVGGMISIMIRETGGYESSYYAGLNLVILALTLLYVWDFRLSTVICLVLFGFYLVPALLYDDILKINILVNNITFILATSLIGLTSAYNRSNLRYLEFESLYKLDVSQKALQDSNLKLKKLGELKDDFFADISHELRTPLAIIRGEAEVSLRGKEKPVGVYKEVLQYIVEMSEQMNQLVGDLLLLARSESGTVTIEKKVISLTQVLKKASREGSALADEKGVPLHYSPESGVDFMIQGDQARLVQLFLIILDNAVKYSNKGGEIRISSQKQGDRVRVTVLDAGVGIPEEDLPHIFDRFYRAGKTKAMSRKGTGLGLSIAKWIVEAHDGEIIVDSTVNKGTAMMIFLPLFWDRPLTAGKA